MPSSGRRSARSGRRRSWGQHPPAADRARYQVCEVPCVAALSSSFAPIMPNLRTKFLIVPRQLATTAAQLQETERRFQLLIDAVTDYAIFMLDKTGHVASWNTGAQRIKGYSAGEIIGHHFSRFYT